LGNTASAEPAFTGKRGELNVHTGLSDNQFQAAMAAAEDDSASPAERAEMLMEIATGLQIRPKGPAQLRSAVELCDKALDLCPAGEKLLYARIVARKATALQAIPGEDPAPLEAAHAAFRQALPILSELGAPEEHAEAEMNLGLVLQTLAGMNRGRITDAIAAYQRALRVFDRIRFPKEFAILQNNLATAFLSIPFSDERSKMREALAVQAFEEGLRVVNLTDDPVEYAMLQNNLGNALQYASSSHRLANNLRALLAYDEALKVRRRETMPLEYANTLTNRANCLQNLPDDPEQPDAGNRGNLRRAKAGYAEAREIFNAHGEREKARIVGEAVFQLERELMDMADGDGGQAQPEHA
jgi:tetratricopeptide (TPR) repeat protein